MNKKQMSETVSSVYPKSGELRVCSKSGELRVESEELSLSGSSIHVTNVGNMKETHSRNYSTLHSSLSTLKAKCILSGSLGIRVLG